MNKFIFTILLFHAFLVRAEIIVIDPGHGGNELGATFKYKRKGKTLVFTEKELTLKLGKYLKEALSGQHVAYLTRSYDKDIDLNERSLIADKVKADIFISLHFNSSKDKRASGIETYYLSNKKNSAVHKIETVENFMQNDLDELTKKILIDLAVEKTINSSKKLAQYVHKATSGILKNEFHIQDRGCKSAMFYVLALAKRPGILIEGGFLSNFKEAKLISSDKYLKKYAYAIAKGINDYFNSEKSLTVSSVEKSKTRL